MSYARALHMISSRAPRPHASSAGELRVSSFAQRRPQRPGPLPPWPRRTGASRPPDCQHQ
eukprot:9729288-Alexandrium_andersonii.AAC.1